jgi:hypothetical protein
MRASHLGSALVLTLLASPLLAQNAPGEPSLEELRALTERFKDVNVALAEGYIRDPADLCVSAELEGLDPAMGQMGVHYIRMDLLGVNSAPEERVNGTGTHTDFREPAVLLYEPQADGSMELVGVENLVFKKAWEEAGHDGPPTFHGVEWDMMADDPATEIDEAHMFQPHYDRHVWIYRENPTGVFTPFNPAVSCQYHASSAGGMP